MSEFISEELLRTLPRLSDVITSNGDIGKEIKTILREVEPGKRDQVEEQLHNCVRILGEFHSTADADENDCIAKVANLGIPEANAEAAVARIRPKSPAPETEPMPKFTETVVEEKVIEKPIQERETEILTILRCLSIIIATEGNVDELLDDVLQTYGLTKGIPETSDIDSYIKILQQAHINANADLNVFIQGLSNNRVPEKYSARAIYTVTLKEESLKEFCVEDDIEFQVARRSLLQRNYVRAVMLGQRQLYPGGLIHHLQKLALKQYASVFRNLPGFRRLVQEYEISRNEVERILNEVIEEHGSSTTSQASLQFDGTAMQNLTLKEWTQMALSSR